MKCNRSVRIREVETGGPFRFEVIEDLPDGRPNPLTHAKTRTEANELCRIAREHPAVNLRAFDRS